MAWLRLWLFIIPLAFVLPVPVRASEIFLTYNHGFLTDEQREVVERLVRGLAKVYQPMFFKLTPEDFAVRAVDLNGDGVDELIAAVDVYWCGSEPWCPAFVYRKVKGSWWFIGEVESDSMSLDIRGRFLRVDSKRHNGWLVLNSDKWSHCWVKSATKEFFEYHQPPFGMPLDTEAGGYYWSVPIGEPCPEHQGQRRKD